MDGAEAVKAAQGMQREQQQQQRVAAKGGAEAPAPAAEPLTPSSGSASPLAARV